jgi:RNA polymerase sigma-70 factor (ECF subfamily)
VYDDESQLLEGLRRRDRFACTCLLKRFMPRLYRLALQVTGNDADAQDALQEGFIKACGQVEYFDGRSALGTWLYRIVLNASLMQLRKRRSEAMALPDYNEGEISGDEISPIERVPDSGRDPGDQMVAEELREKLDQAILLLPDSLRAAFVLRDLEELSTKEAADALGISEAALKVRLHRARLALRGALAPYFPEYRLSMDNPAQGAPAQGAVEQIRGGI